MKKRFVTTLLSLIACIACVIGLVACGTDSVAGKTYEFDKVEITKGLEGELKETMEEQLNNNLGECYLEFNEDGTFKMSFGSTVTGTYTQDGNKLTLTSDGEDVEATISGDTVTMEQEQQGFGMKVTFKLVAQENPNEVVGTITNP